MPARRYRGLPPFQIQHISVEQGHTDPPDPLAGDPVLEGCRAACVGGYRPADHRVLVGRHRRVVQPVGFQLLLQFHQPHPGADGCGAVPSYLDPSEPLHADHYLAGRVGAACQG